MSQTAAVWCTVLLAVNRYVALCLPFQACRWATVRIVRLQLLAVVIGLLVLNVPRFFQYEVSDNYFIFHFYLGFVAINEKPYYLIIIVSVTDCAMTPLHLNCLFLP